MACPAFDRMACPAFDRFAVTSWNLQSGSPTTLLDRGVKHDSDHESVLRQLRQLEEI